MQEKTEADIAHEDRITERAGQLSKQLEVRCIANLMDQVKAFATSAQTIIDIKEVEVTLDVAIVTAIGTRAGASNKITMTINPYL